MKDFHIEQEDRGNIKLVRLHGSLDMYSFPHLEMQLNNLFHQGHYCVLLDCSQLDYIGSAGLGALIGFTKLARENQGDLKLLQVPDRIYKIIELLGFTKVLQVYSDEETALAEFNKP
jgi:anti-sigma B factor antagonist